MASVKMMMACVEAGGWAHLECSPFLAVGKGKKFDDLDELEKRAFEHMTIEDLVGNKWVVFWPEGWYWVRCKDNKEARIAYCDGSKSFPWYLCGDEEGGVAATSCFDRIVPIDIPPCPFKAKGPFVK